ncbi:MAG: aryl-sulfate sulfotransferase [Saprospiraceae bacterium]|nr:aryl-sulfate sulfotransferase [Saprospiraceae bacterium]
MQFRFFLFFLFSFGTLLAQNRTVGVFQNDAPAFNGYTLFTTGRLTYLIDNCGHEVRRWTSNYQPGLSVYLLENGNLLRTGRVGGSFSGGGVGGRLELFSWEGDLLWAWEYADDRVHQHHDVAPLPNGNILVLAWERVTAAEAEALGRRPNTVSSTGLWPEHLVEIRPVGADSAEIVWQWRLWDHLVQDAAPGLPNYAPGIADRPERLDINTGQPNTSDWVHCNAVSYNPQLDQIALCSRVLSEIWIIDHSTTTAEAAGSTGGNSGRGGDILYRWGNPQAYGRGGAVQRRLWGPHDVRWVAGEHPWAGKLMVFNNGVGRPGGNLSSVEVWAPPLNDLGTYDLNPGQPFGPAASDWSYSDANFYSSNISGAHAVPNGNIVVCEGDDGRFFEVDTLGNTHWSYINPVGMLGPVSQGQTPANNATFRVTRYAPGYPAFAGRDLTPGPLVELNPLPETCVLQTVGNGPEPDAEMRIFVHGNPLRDQLTLQNDTGNELTVAVADVLGRLVYRGAHAGETISIACADWPAGGYVLQVHPAGYHQPMIFNLIKH